MTYLALIFAAMLVQTFLSYRQYLAVQSQVGALRKEFPIVSVGSSRGILNRSAVLAVDHAGMVQKALMLSGFTIFARLQEVSSLNGAEYSRVKELCFGNRKMRCVVNAVAFVEKYFEDRNNRENRDD